MGEVPRPIIWCVPAVGSPSWRTRRGSIRLCEAPISAKARTIASLVRTAMTGKVKGGNDAQLRGTQHHLGTGLTRVTVGQHSEYPLMTIGPPELLHCVQIVSRRKQDATYRFALVLFCDLQEDPGLWILRFPCIDGLRSLTRDRFRVAGMLGTTRHTLDSSASRLL